MKINRRLKKSLYYDGPPYKISLGLALFILVFVIFIICDGYYFPLSYIGQKRVIILAVETAFKVLSHFFLWWFGGFLIVRWLYKNGHNLKWSEILQPVLMSVVAIGAMSLPFVLYSSRVNPKDSGDLLYDFLLPFYVISDVAGDDTKTIEFSECTMTRVVGSSWSEYGGYRDYTSQVILHVKGRDFTIGKTDDNKFKRFVTYYPYYDKETTAVSVYYSHSGLIKSVDIIKPETEPEEIE